MQPEFNIVIPLYNESAVFNQLVDRLQLLIKSSNYSIEVLLVDDGSKDDTAVKIKSFCDSNNNFKGVLLSRNFGHQIAVSAGLSQVNASKGIMVIDGDLQDPPELLFGMIERLAEGNDVVYAVRKKRKESYFKKTAYFIFYRILNSISYLPLPLDSGDFCLMSRRVVDLLNKMPEESRYIRGMRTWVGFKQVGYEYERAERAAGEPKYNFKMLLSLAYNGIFNFSEYPIKLVTRMGITGTLAAFLYLGYVIIKRFTSNEVPTGFTALLFCVILFGSLTLLSIGIIGEYIVRIFFQVKQRPTFIIDKIISKNE
jgi:dolichol-phosphate mannosyltransferase